MKNLYKILIASSAFLMSQNIYAASCAQTSNVIGLVGLGNPDGKIYAGVSGHNNQCGCDIFRFSAKSTDTKAALSILLSAKMANKKVRIDLSDDTDCDSAIKAYVE